MNQNKPVLLAHDDAGQGNPVVLIHGFPLCRRMWRSQVPALVAAGFRVITPDLRGYGETPPGSAPSSMDTYADDLIALLDELGIEQAVLGGMSMGGYVLLNLLERYPKRVAAAMFLVTRAAEDDPAAKERRQVLAAETRQNGPGKVAEIFENILFAPGVAQNRPELVNEVRQWMLVTSPQAMAAGLLAMRDRKDSLSLLPRFQRPALVIGAVQDLAVPLEHSQALAEGLPKAILRVIEGAGHMANMEKPEIFNRHLLEFLQNL